MASEEHEAIRASQIKKSVPYMNHKPSDPAVQVSWIYALRQKDKDKYPADNVNSGKWLVFAPVEEVDEIWAKIKSVVEDGLLGNRAKVASIYGARVDKFTGKKRQVICVYTYDWKDKEDVMRIREELRKLGITEILSYKADADTMAGKYRHTGNNNISKYRA
jgi:hypothetical protein